MAPFISGDFHAVIRRLEGQIEEIQNRLVELRNRQHHRENRLEELLSQQNTEEEVLLLLQQNDETVRQIRTMEESIPQKERRIRELNLKYQVALCREEHQRRYGW